MNVFNFNHVPDWFKKLLIFARTARCGALENSGLLLLVMNIVYAVDFAFTAFFSWNVFSILAHLLRDWNRLLWRVQALMNLNLAFHSLKNSVTRALFWSILGTHRLRLSGLDRSVGPTSVLRDWYRLISTLRSWLTYNSTGRTVSHFYNSGRTYSEFRTATDNWPGGEPFSYIRFLSNHIDLLLFDYRSLVTHTLVGLLRTYTAPRIRPKVFYLTNMTSLLHVSQNYSSFSNLLSIQAALGDIRFYKWVLWHEKAGARLLHDGLTKLGVATLLRHLVLSPCATSSLSLLELSLIINIGILSTKPDLMDLIYRDSDGGSGRLGSLRRGFLKSACVLGCSLSGKNTYGRIRIRCGLRPRLLRLVPGPHYWRLSFFFGQNFINSLLLMNLEFCQIIARSVD